MEIPEGYVLVPKEAYDLLISAARPRMIYTMDPSQPVVVPRFGEPSVTCNDG